MVRDLTTNQFRVWLIQNDFRRIPMGWVEDLQNPGHSYGLVMEMLKGGQIKTRYRASVQKLLESRRKTQQAKKD